MNDFDDALQLCRDYGYTIEVREDGYIITPSLRLFLKTDELIEFLNSCKTEEN